MSIASYERNVARGVTGPYIPVCFPAALEQVSAYSYRPSVYQHYEEFMNRWCRIWPAERRDDYDPLYRDMVEGLVRPLGGLAFEDVVFSQAKTSLGWMRIVKKLLREDYLIVADVKTPNGKHTCHSVGIIPTPQEDYVSLVSTHLPPALQGIVPLQRVSELMHTVPKEYKPSQEFPFRTANITALPAA